MLAASILSAPAALLLSKVLIPETSKPETYGRIPKEVEVSPHANVIDAAASGASEGLTLALNVAAMLIAFIALMALLNSILQNFGDIIGFGTWGATLIPEALRTDGPAQLTLQTVFGWVFAPLAWSLEFPRMKCQSLALCLARKRY